MMVEEDVDKKSLQASYTYKLFSFLTQAKTYVILPDCIIPPPTTSSPS